jgi:stage III sporulation protein AA
VKNIVSVLPDRIRNVIESENIFSSASELVLRLERPSCVCFGKERLFISSNGLTHQSCKAILLYRYEIDSIFEKLCKSSVYSFEEQIKNGFISVNGGHRVGLCGTAVVKNGYISGFRDISGFVFRIAREMIGVGEEVSKYIVKSHKVVNTAIISPPGGGKTTVLRDLCRILGESGKRVCIVDERGELCGISDGVPSFSSVGLCDILDCCPKADGIGLALRTLCPDVIVFDEICDVCEAQNLVSAMNSGVSFVFSTHADSFEAAAKRAAFQLLLKNGALDLSVVLGVGEKRGKIVELKEIKYGADKYEAICIDTDPLRKFVSWNI